MTPKKLRRRILKILTILVAIWSALQLVAWKMSSGDEGSNRFNRMAIFGGNQFTTVATALTSGRAAVVLGGLAVDLSGAQLDPTGADLVIDCKFAGVAVTVPDDWRVLIVEQGIKGGDIALDVTDPTTLPSDAPVLRITANVLMGGVAIATA
jgi:hypothetical protein